MTFTRNRLAILIVLIQSCVVVLTAVSIPYAQEGNYFFMERPKLGLGASYELEEENRTFPGMKTEATSHDMRENMTLGTNGWAYHPNLLEYRLFFEPEWRQERFGESGSAGNYGQTEKRDTSVMAYDVGATLLKRKPCSLDVFANRNNRQFDLSYARDTEFESETWGTRLHFTNPTLPASFGFTNRKFVQTGFYRSEEDRDELQVKIRHNAKSSITELNMLHDEADRLTRTASTSADTASTTTNTELTNTYFFANDNQVRLDSLVYNTRAEYDAADYDTLILSENLFWTHSKDLLSQYAFHYNRWEVGDTDTEEKAVKAGLIHHLYNRLTTNLGAEAAFSDFESGSEDRYDSNLGFLYRRPIPKGSFELGAAYDYGITNRSGVGNIIPIEEHHVLTSTTETYLNKQNIDLNSIMVTNATGTIVYVRDVDYRAESMGQDVRISRTLLGAIADNQQVIVRYNYLFDSGYDDARFGQDYRFSLELWSFFYLTYTHGRLNQYIQSGIPMNEPIDDTRNTVRLRFVIKWSETQFLLERQDRSNGNSSVTRSVRELINLRPVRNVSFNLSGDCGRRDFTDTGEMETFYTFGTDIGWTPKWWCHFSLICLRNGISGDRQDMLYWEIAPNVRLTYGVWTGIIAYQLKDQEDHENGDGLWRQRIYFGISRSLW